MPEALARRPGVPILALFRVGFREAVGEGDNGFDEAFAHRERVTERAEGFNRNSEAGFAPRSGATVSIGIVVLEATNSGGHFIVKRWWRQEFMG